MRAGALLVGRPRQQLSEAHSLESEGQFQAAAQQFAELSDKAADYGMLDRAGNLSLQAARARQELVTAGARPRRQRLIGVEALTASERRVAQMAEHIPPLLRRHVVVWLLPYITGGAGGVTTKRQ